MKNKTRDIKISLSNEFNEYFQLSTNNNNDKK